MNITKSKRFFLHKLCEVCRTVWDSNPRAQRANGFQGFYDDDERSERRDGESDATERRYGESDATERRDGESDTPDAGTVNAM